VDRKIKSAGK